MSTLYLIALTGVALAMLAALYEALAALHAPPCWAREQPAALSLVDSVDRRTMPLPFVGMDRRRSAADAPADANRHVA